MSLQENNSHAAADFAATLEAHRVPRDALRAALSSRRAAAVSNQAAAPPHPFPTATFARELRRVRTLVDDQQKGLERAAKALFLRAEALASATSDARSVPASSSAHTTLRELQRSTGRVVEDCLALQEFFTGSRRILGEAAAAADAQRLAGAEQPQQQEQQAVHCGPLVHEHLPKAHLNSSLVCVVSDIYQALRRAEENIRNNNGGGGGGDSLWEAPSSFKRSTTKYWVANENLTRLMLICAAEAPLLVYGQKGPLTSTTNKVDGSEGDKFWDKLATRVNSIYFDSEDMVLYRERIQRAEGAQLLRVRWYGASAMPQGDKVLFLELKTHHEKWVAQKSVKERATIQERDMVEFLRPVRWQPEDAEQMIVRAKPKLQEDAEGLAKQTGLLLRMHNLCVKHRLNACVRTVYDRAAFQSSKSNDLRLTLDRNVTVVNERVPPAQPRSPGQWCLTDAEAQTARANVVPFNVFEVKLAGDDPMPPGLAQAENDSTMMLATKFSKFLTGAAAFNVVPILPYWAAHPAFYAFFELDRRAGPKPSSESNGTNQGDYNLMGSSHDEMDAGTHRIPRGIAFAPKFPARIEPKTYFANERTFVQWISASILLLSVSGFMLEAGSVGEFKSTAAVISLSALGLLMYSTGLYFQRLNLLKDRQPYGYFNKANPIFLTTVVGLAIFLVWADSIKGGDIFSFSASGRRLLRSRLTGRILHEVHEKCPQVVAGTEVLIKEHPSSFVVDFKKHSLLLTSDESVYIQPMDDDGSVTSKADSLIRINQSHLQGLAIVGDRLFAVSDGPERTELIEMAWWETFDGHKRLRVVGRWTLEDSKSQVDGFSYVPSSDSVPIGTFYINMNSSIQVYSLPAQSDHEEPGQSSHPMRLRSLNMKVLTQGMSVEDKGSSDRLSTMITFAGITYILRSEKHSLAAWNLTDGTLVSEIVLPTIDDDHFVMKWTGFALNRRIATSTETPNVRGGNIIGTISSDVLLLHLMTEGGQIWSFFVHEDIKTPNGLFSVPDCQIAKTGMN